MNITFGFEWETDASEGDVESFVERHRGWNWYEDGPHYELNSPPTPLKRPTAAIEHLFFLPYDYCDVSESGCGAHIHIKAPFIKEPDFIYHYFAAVPLFWKFFVHGNAEYGFYHDRDYWAGPNYIDLDSGRIEVLWDSKRDALTYNSCCGTLELRLNEAEPIRAWAAVAVIVAGYLAGEILEPPPDQVERNWDVLYEQPSHRKPFYTRGPLRTENDILPYALRVLAGADYFRGSKSLIFRILETVLSRGFFADFEDFRRRVSPLPWWAQEVFNRELALTRTRPITAYL